MGSGPRTKLVSVFGWEIDGGMCGRREKPSKGNGMGSSRGGCRECGKLRNE